jgi:hypothetical protein
MPKPSTKKSTTEVVQETIVSTPAPIEVKSKKVTAPKVAVTAPVTVSPVVVAAAPAPVVVDDSHVDVVDVESPITEKSIEFLAKLSQIGTLLSSLKAEYRVLEKVWTKELKIAQKASSKRKRKAGNRAPSGFVKPTLISEELANFLGKPLGSEMARTEVTRDVNKYIRSNDLQDKVNGRKINPDVKLATLLKLTKTDELTYFNLQRYMSPHFAKAAAKVATVV